jgi:hypothetical protein
LIPALPIIIAFVDSFSVGTAVGLIDSFDWVGARGERVGEEDVGTFVGILVGDEEGEAVGIRGGQKFLL